MALQNSSSSAPPPSEIGHLMPLPVFKVYLQDTGRWPAAPKAWCENVVRRYNKALCPGMMESLKGGGGQTFLSKIVENQTKLVSY